MHRIREQRKEWVVNLFYRGWYKFLKYGTRQDAIDAAILDLSFIKKINKERISVGSCEDYSEIAE